MKGLPKKPVLVYKHIDHLPWCERNKAICAHEKACNEYMAKVVEYVNEKGAKGLPMNRIRTFFEAESIRCWGGRRILEHRWEKYVKGEDVARDEKYAYKRPLPTFTLFDRQSSLTFPLTDVRCIPLDVLGMHLLPFLDVGSLFNLLRACKQFQALVQRELLCRSKLEFGEGGTPMALYYKYIRFGGTVWSDYDQGKIRTYRCIDNYRTTGQYLDTQKGVNDADSDVHARMMNEDFAFVSAIVTKTLGKAFAIKQDTHNHLIKCVFVYTASKLLLVEGTQLLRTCSRYCNNGERSEKRIVDALLKHAPDARVRALLDIVVSTNIANYAIHSSAPYPKNLALFITDLAEESKGRGMDWAEKVLRKAYSYNALTYFGHPRFVFNDENDVVIKFIRL